MSENPINLSPDTAVLASSDDFRAAMRKFAASVTIVTTNSDGQPHGMTATAVSSVSADPPTILVVINRTARTHPLIGSAGAFAVNLLARDQQGLANRFSVKHPDQFDGIDYFESPHIRAPVFYGVASFVECRLISQKDVGTHTVFFGEVLHCGTAGAVPLLYYEGAFVEMTAAAAGR